MYGFVEDDEQYDDNQKFKGQEQMICPMCKDTVYGFVLYEGSEEGGCVNCLNRGVIPWGTPLVYFFKGLKVFPTVPTELPVLTEG